MGGRPVSVPSTVVTIGYNVGVAELLGEFAEGGATAAHARAAVDIQLTTPFGPVLTGNTGMTPDGSSPNEFAGTVIPALVPDATLPCNRLDDDAAGVVPPLLFALPFILPLLQDILVVIPVESLGVELSIVEMALLLVLPLEPGAIACSLFLNI